ncbi:MAG: hypothetical protein WC423_10485 [Vulcanimicrobiota bacterium]
MVLALLLVAVSAVAQQGLGTLRQARVEESKKQAVLAAEAAAVDAMEQLVSDPTFEGPVAEVEMDIGATYSATILNNTTAGGGTQFASNGAEVPEGCAYILAQGEMGTIRRQVGVLVTRGSASALGIAVGVGGLVDMSGSKRIAGTIKANGDIDLSGSTRIEPLDSSGQLLSSKAISVSGSTRIDDTQDVLARNGVSGNIRGAYEINGSDTSVSTEPFINDYRTTNSLLSGEKGSVLPNPDPTVLLAGAIIYDDDGDPLTTQGPASPDDLNLGGQVHYFPYGLDFSGSSTITGPGTVVVGGGYPMNFSGSSRIAQVNLVAIRGSYNGFPNTPSNDASISLSGSSRITGLVYAHDGVDVSGSFRLEGLVIAYDSVTGNFTTSGSTRIELDSTVLADIPGFEPWADGFGGTGGIPAGSASFGVVSWERL